MTPTLKAPFKLIMIIIACLLFLGAGLAGPWGTPPAEWPWRGRMIAWGLFFWAASTLVTD
jgi:hypothetical protein